MRAPAAAALLILAIAGCVNDEPLSIPPPDGRPQGSLLVLETRACNWLLPPDENKCDPVGLVRIGLDGEVLEDLTPEAHAGPASTPAIARRQFALSPDRDAIAWTWNWEVWVMDLDGDAPRNLVPKLLAEIMGETATDPTWAPDGSELLYRWSGANAEQTWYRVALESGAMTEVSLPVDCIAMAWAPDGKHVACEVVEPEEEEGRFELADLFLVDLETLEATELTDRDDAISNHSPDWSPDGRWLAFSRETHDAELATNVNGIWVLEVETGEGKLLAPGSFSVPSWSPDGGHLAAFDDEQSKLVIMGRDGSGLTTLDHDPRQFVAPRWLP